MRLSRSQLNPNHSAISHHPAGPPGLSFPHRTTPRKSPWTRSRRGRAHPTGSPPARSSRPPPGTPARPLTAPVGAPGPSCQNRTSRRPAPSHRRAVRPYRRNVAAVDGIPELRRLPHDPVSQPRIDRPQPHHPAQRLQARRAGHIDRQGLADACVIAPCWGWPTHRPISLPNKHTTSQQKRGGIVPLYEAWHVPTPWGYGCSVYVSIFLWK
jgi:hypothetical protein